MRTAIIFLALLSAQILSQSYLGVSYNNGDPSNSTEISLIQKITFTNSAINFILSDNTTTSKGLSTIFRLTFSGTDGGNLLPVELESFTVFLNGCNVFIQWRTLTEVRNSGFDIEKTVSSKEFLLGSWKKIGFVKGYVLSNSPKDYSFTDSVNGGEKLYYRLKQIDTDGKYQYSKIVEVEVGIPLNYQLKQNFPNPFNPRTRILYYLPVDGFVTLKVFDALGREEASLVNEIKKAGSYEVTFNGSPLASGIYICKMSSKNFNSSIKMLLLK